MNATIHELTNIGKNMNKKQHCTVHGHHCDILPQMLVGGDRISAN